MERNRSFVLAALTLFYLACVAQTNPNELDNRYTPNQNAIFTGQLHSNKTSASASGAAPLRNNIKFSPTFLLRKKFLLFYERDLGKGFSINTGIGKAFGTDVFERTYFQIAENGAAGAMEPGQMLAQSEFSSSSTFFSAGPRYYFSGETFDEGYIEFYYRHESITYKLNEQVSSVQVLGERDATFTMNAFGIGFGANILAGARDNISHDFFVQVGVKLFNFPRYELQNNTGSFPRTSFFIPTSQTLHMSLLPALNFSYAFGFGF